MKKLLLIFVSIALLMSISSCGKKEVVEDTPVITQSEEAIQKQIKEEMKDDVEDISQKLESWDMTEEEAKAAMLDSINSSETIQTQLEKSKVQMPKLLEILKASQECLKGAKSKSDAVKCNEQTKELAEKLWVSEMFDDEEDDDDFEWSNEIREETLVEIKGWIDEFEKMLPCIEKAENMSDMMQCGADS